MRRRKVPTRVEGVEVVFVDDATRLFTHREGDAVASSFLKGAIVRIVPGGESTGPERVALRDFILSHGARHAWLAPRAAAPMAVTPESVRERPEEPARVVIMRMVDEAHTADRPRLQSVVEAAITAEGI